MIGMYLQIYTGTGSQTVMKKAWFLWSVSGHNDHSSASTILPHTVWP